MFLAYFICFLHGLVLSSFRVAVPFAVVVVVVVVETAAAFCVMTSNVVIDVTNNEES